MIRDGLVDVALVGGSESATLPLTVAAFAQMTALTKNPDPETASRPFDAARDGFVLSEGACTSDPGARVARHGARRARIYGEVAGYGASDDAFHITAPDPKGTGAAIAIRAGAPGRRRGAVGGPVRERPRHLDAAERRRRDRRDQGGARRRGRPPRGRVVHEVDDRAHARRRRRGRGAPPRSSRSSDGIDPADDPLRDAGPRLRPRLRARTEARTADVRFAISNSFGFGGQNAVVAFRKAP